MHTGLLKSPKIDKILAIWSGKIKCVTPLELEELQQSAISLFRKEQKVQQQSSNYLSIPTPPWCF